MEQKEKLEICVIRSNRKSIALEVKPDLSVVVRAPYCLSEQQILKFVDKKSDWLYQHIEKMKKRKEEQENRPRPVPFTREELEKLADEALRLIPERVKYYAPIVGVTYGRITIRNQHTRWGSCSAKGNLNFNCLLMLAPPEVTDYVVVHELCHRLEMNHSSRFWAEVNRVLPNYKSAKKWLSENGSTLMERNP